MKEAPTDRAKKLLTEALLLLTGLRVRRDVARMIFQGVRIMRDSDTYLMILEEGQEKQLKEDILLAGEARLGAHGEAIKTHLEGIKDLAQLKRMFRRALEGASWKEILETP
jgi:hypothetical protein